MKARVLPILVVVPLQAAWAQLDPLDSALQKGDRLIMRLPPPPPDFSNTMVFEANLAGKTLGYSEFTLRAEQKDGKIIYRYGQELVVQTDEGARTSAVIQAELTQHFAPTEINTRVTVRSASGSETVTTERCTVSADKVTITRRQDDQESSQQVPLPRTPFVFGLEQLMERLNVEESAPFALRDFVQQTGTVHVIRFGYAKNEDGTARVNGSRDGKEPDRYFVLAANGSVTAYGEQTARVTLLRVSKDRGQELRKQFGGG